MVAPQEMALSPRQPFDGQRVRRTPGFGRIQQLTTRHSKKTKDFRISTLNIGTLRDKEEEIVELMRERKLLVMGLCETQTKESDDRIIHAGYRLISRGVDTGRHGVGIMLAPELETCVERYEQNGERIFSISLKMKDAGITIIQIYASQQGRTSAEKDAFYE